MAVPTEEEAAAQTAADRALPEAELGSLVLELNARIKDINAEGERLAEEVRSLLARGSELNDEARAIDLRLRSLVRRENITTLRFLGNLL